MVVVVVVRVKHRVHGGGFSIRQAADSTNNNNDRLTAFDPGQPG